MSGMFEFPAVLTRELRVRLIDASGSGCRFEMGRRLEVGTIGRLHVKLGAEDCEDDIEVLRCEPVAGVGTYEVAVRLLWTTPPRRGSIRHAVARLIEKRDPSDITHAMERAPGH